MLERLTPHMIGSRCCASRRSRPAMGRLSGASNPRNRSRSFSQRYDLSGRATPAALNLPAAVEREDRLNDPVWHTIAEQNSGAVRQQIHQLARRLIKEPLTPVFVERC